MRKSVFLTTIGCLILALLFTLYAATEANGDPDIRGFLCRIFNCQAFVDLVTKVDDVNQKTDVIATTTDSNALVIGAIETKVDGIVEQFPIEVGVPTELSEQLDRIEKQLGYFSKSELSVWLEVPAGTLNDVIDIKIMIRGESLREVKAFGFDMIFDSTMFEYQSAEKAKLTSSWALLDANEVSAGTLRCGGVLGSGSPIVGDVIGELIIAKLMVIGSQPTSQLCLQNYVDDLVEFMPATACGEFILE